jgi:hypothetical protein
MLLARIVRPDYTLPRINPGLGQLVPLIIFMSTLPLTQRGVDMNLPLETRTTQPPRSDQTQVIVELTADRRLAVNEVAVPMVQVRLGTRFDARRFGAVRRVESGGFSP